MIVEIENIVVVAGMLAVYLMNLDMFETEVLLELKVDFVKLIVETEKSD